MLVLLQTTNDYTCSFKRETQFSHTKQRIKMSHFCVAFIFAKVCVFSITSLIFLPFIKQNSLKYSHNLPPFHSVVLWWRKTLKYKKCPRCQLNYIAEDWNICSVCQNEIDGKKSIFDEESDVLLCPCCHKHELGLDEVVCVHCQRKRYRHFDE